MQYLGGKSKEGKYIAEVIARLADKSRPDERGIVATGRYVEVMVGGGAVAAAVGATGAFDVLEAGDIHPHLISMYRGLTEDGWEPPETMTEADWYRLKDEACRQLVVTPLHGFAGFACSFSGQWFNNPARENRGNRTGMIDKCPSSRRSILRDLPHWKRFSFRHLSYDEWDLQPGDVVYADKPYKGTKGYAGTEFNSDGSLKHQVAVTGFDEGAFWLWANALEKRGVRLLISESNEPPFDSFVTCWHKIRQMGQAVSLGWRDSERNADGSATRGGGEVVADRLICPIWCLGIARGDSSSGSDSSDTDEEEGNKDTFAAGGEPEVISVSEEVESCGSCFMPQGDCLCGETVGELNTLSEEPLLEAAQDFRQTKTFLTVSTVAEVTPTLEEDSSGWFLLKKTPEIEGKPEGGWKMKSILELRASDKKDRVILPPRLFEEARDVIGNVSDDDVDVALALIDLDAEIDRQSKEDANLFGGE